MKKKVCFYSQNAQARIIDFMMSMLSNDFASSVTAGNTT